MQKLTIVAYLDGKPGHDKQTRALVEALARNIPVETRFVHLPAESLFRRFSSWTSFFCGLKQRQAHGDTDLIIGAGRRTHLPMLLHRRNLAPRARVVVCMAPGWLAAREIDLCLVPFHDNPEPAGNILVTTGPPCLPVNKRRHREARGLILVGGIDEKSHFWDGAQVIGMVSQLMNQGTCREWTLSSSRRTPEATLRQLEQLAAQRPGVRFFRADHTPPGWIEEQYDLNRTVWVTADSVSMLYEALAAGCRVGVLPVKWKRENNKFQRGLTMLSEKNMILSFENWLAGAVFPSGETELNEAARCAREILRRWWPENLPS